jgi:DNA-binding NarL/FixJ family response regulator
MADHKKDGVPGAKKAMILIVDDHPLTREGLAAHIARQPDLEVCGEAEDVADAFEKVRVLDPDLVIVDLSLKSGPGLELIKLIKARGAKTKMLVSSMYDESLFAERVLRAGASGYVNKQVTAAKVVEAIRLVLAGRVYLSPEMTESLLQRSVGAVTPSNQNPVDTLSDRELEVFRMIGRGMTVKKIARDLKLSIKTVETHRKRIKDKLHLCNGAELSREAVRWVLETG